MDDERRAGGTVGLAARRNNREVTYVYLSHGRDDPRFLVRLVKHLRRYHVSVRYDTEPESSERFETLVRPFIDGCAAFLVVGSPDGYPAPVVLREVEYATSVGKPGQLLDRGGPIPMSLSDLPRIGLWRGLPDDEYVSANRAIPLSALAPRLPGMMGLIQVRAGVAAPWSATGIPRYVKVFWAVMGILFGLFMLVGLTVIFLGPR